jgi:hypothetical protein
MSRNTISKSTIHRIALLTALAAATAFISIAGAASAATVTYSNTTAFSVPNNTGIAGVDLKVNVPAGLPPVQKAEVQMAPSFPTGGGADLSYKLRDPSGTEMFVMLSPCPFSSNASNFTISDDATYPVGQVTFCNNLQSGGSGLPDDPDGKKLAIFQGKPSGGDWVLNVRDIGLNTTQGTLRSWAVKLTHEPLAIVGKAKRQRVKRKAKVMLTCNADCSVTAGGDAKGRTYQLDQDEATRVGFPIKGKALNRVADGGKLKLKLTVTDATGETVVKKVKVKVAGVRAAP